MTQQDLDIVRRLFDSETQKAIWSGRVTVDHPLLSIWHPECVIEELADIPDAASYHGRAGVMRYFRQVPEVWERLTYAPVELLDAPDGVLATTDIVGRSKAGVDARLRVYQAFRVRDGMILSVKAYADRGQALADVGLPTTWPPRVATWPAGTPGSPRRG